MTHTSTEQPIEVTIIGKKVWIEGDLLGAKHVMVQHDLDGEKPFCYASFHYNWRHTCNAGTRADAEAIARQLGAQDPIEYRNRPAAETFK